MLESATSRRMRLRQEWQLGCSRNWLSKEALRMEGVEPSRLGLADYMRNR